MSSNAYIKLVPKSKQTEISLNDVKELFYYYKENTSKLGEQLNWDYAEAAFPYDIKETSEGKGNWFYLNGTKDRYNLFAVGVSTESTENGEQAYIQITLPNNATHGDKGKANEFCKFLAKKLDGELHLFNGRIMYYYKR